MTDATARLLALRKAEVLTDREWHVLMLRFVHELTLGQIALALDVSRGTVSGTIRRAVQKAEIHERKEAA